MLLQISSARADMVDVAQLVRATDCGSVGRGFEPHLPPQGVSCDTPYFFCCNVSID